MKDNKIINGGQQISANRGPDSSIVLEANFKPLVPKSSRSSETKTQNCAYTNHEFQPGWNMPEYQHSYTNTVETGDINTMSCPIKSNSNTIELTVHTSCYCVLDLLCVSTCRCSHNSEEKENTLKILRQFRIYNEKISAINFNKVDNNNIFQQ